MKNYLIIGASSGIGRALAGKLQDAGHRVFGTYCNHPQADENNLSFHHLNVLDTIPALDYLPESLDGLAYCPGSISLKPFNRIKPEDFLQDYSLQVLGAVKLLQAVAPHLKKAPAPAVVLFSTIAVQSGFPFHTQVSTSKGAVEGLTKALAAEWAPKIRVNCIAPSITDTPLAGQLLSTPEKKEANAQRHPLRRIGEAADIASLAAFLLGEDASWVTGQIWHADGGLSTLRV